MIPYSPGENLDTTRYRGLIHYRGVVICPSEISHSSQCAFGLYPSGSPVLSWMWPSFQVFYLCRRIPIVRVADRASREPGDSHERDSGRRLRLPFVMRRECASIRVGSCGIAVTALEDRRIGS